jgi:hypothetical protein
MLLGDTFGNITSSCDFKSAVLCPDLSVAVNSRMGGAVVVPGTFVVNGALVDVTLGEDVVLFVGPAVVGGALVSGTFVDGTTVVVLALGTGVVSGPFVPVVFGDGALVALDDEPDASGPSEPLPEGPPLLEAAWAD